jgi:transcription antitermination factor NusA-like protein
MALTRISNEFYMDFELYAKIVQARLNRGLNVFSRSSHQTFVKKIVESEIDESLFQQMDNVWRAEKALSKIVNYKK